MAEGLCALATSTGMDAQWYLEEMHDHPAHPISLTRDKGHPEFARACLRYWQDFAHRVSEKQTLHILEGSVFQSNVRFMMEQRRQGISEYFGQFEKILSVLSPVLIYLRPKDVAQHSRDISILRGSAWTGKVAQYLEKTPYCVNRKLSGEDGMHQFWANYALLCDELIACSVMPVKVIDVIFGSWDKSLSNGVEFLDGQGLALGSNRLNLANEPDFKWNVRA